jgi:hypothetical protein
MGLARHHPINGVTWNDAIAYCNWLSKKEKIQPAYSKKDPNFICNFKANGYRYPLKQNGNLLQKAEHFLKDLNIV